MAKLIRVILIDSLCAGEKAEIMLDGNTSITGTNGIGKSSFLKLIPIFYGASPGRVVKSDANNKNFADWYLPYDSSFIIFEYENSSNDRCCALVHRSGISYSYRLISGPWRDELVYRDVDSGLLVATNDLIRHISRLGQSCTAEINPRAYRYIIQFNTANAHLERFADTSDRKMIEACRRTFSLAPKNREFAGIDKVTLAMINEGTSFESIAGVMASILEQDHGNLDNVMTPLANQGFRRLLNDIESYTLYETKLRDKLVKLDDLHVQYVAKSRLLTRAKQRALLAKVLIDDEIAATDRTRAEKEDLYEKNNQLIEQERELLSAEHGNAISEKYRVNSDIERITKEQARYAEQDIERLVALRAESDGLTLQRNQKQQERDQLVEAGGDINYRYSLKRELVVTEAERLSSQRREQAQKQERILQERIKKINSQGQDDLVALELQQKKVIDEVEDRHRSATTALIHRQAELEQSKSARFLPRDQQALDVAQGDIRNRQKAKEACQFKLEDLKRHEQDLKQQQQDKATAKSRHESSLDRLGQRKATLVAELNAGADTLLGFLRGNHSTWAGTIGKLVPSSILMRKDLNPEMRSQANESLFGVNLNLTALPSSSIADPVELQQGISQVEADIQSFTADVDELKKDARKLDASFRAIEADLRLAKSALAQAVDDLDDAESLFQGIEERGRENHIKHIEKLEMSCKQLDDRADQVAMEQKDISGELGRQRVALTKATELSVAELTDEIEQVKAVLAEQLASINSRKDKDLADLNANCDLALTEAGVDSQLGRKLQRELTKLEAALKEVQDNQKTVDQYQRWKTDTLPLLDSLSPQLETAEATVANIARRLERVNQQRKALQLALSADRRVLDTTRARLTSEQTTAIRVLESLADTAPDETAVLEPNKRIQDIDLEADMARSARDAINKQGRSLYTDVVQIYSGDLVVSPHGAEITRLASAGRNESGFETLWIGASGQLLSHMESFHAEQRSKLIIHAQSLSSSVSASKHRLEDMHKSILKLGREATEKAQSASTSFESIEHVEFHMDSKIRSLDFWAYLDEYDKAYTRWQDSGPDDLPTMAFKQALQRIESFTRDQKGQAKAKTTVLDCFSVRIDVIDKGNMKKATNNSEYNGISSEGLRKILLCMLFVALFELVRDDADLQLVIPLDEILKLAAENYISVVRSINDRGAVALAGFPGSPELMSQFSRNYALKSTPRGIEIREYVNAPEETQDILSDLIMSTTSGGVFA